MSTQDAIRAVTFAEVVILVMDATHPFETQDLQIADLVEREGRGLVFVLAKWDLIEEPGAALKELQARADESLPQLRGSPLVTLSAETGRGMDRLMPAVVKAHTDWSTKVKTSDLNDWLQMAIQRHPPPAVNGRRIKPKYISQIKARPPTFVLHASRAGQLPDSYRRYLVNSIRHSFDLPGTPVRLTVKSSSNPYADEGAADVRPAVRSARAAKREASKKAAGKPGAARVKPRGAKAVAGKSAAVGRLGASKGRRRVGGLPVAERHIPHRQAELRRGRVSHDHRPDLGRIGDGHRDPRRGRPRPAFGCA